MDILQAIPRTSELSAHLIRLPTTDRGTLAGFTSIQDIQAWTKTKADEYRQFALSLLTIHNLAAPIHRLPTEVLAQILECCWVDRKSFLLPHVCRLWRSILLRRTAFWADAVTDCQFHGKRKVLQDDSELPFINALLARSTQHSRTIKPTFFGFTEPIAESLTPYKNNLASLHVTVAEDDLTEYLWPLLHCGLPNLKDLAIHIMTPVWMGFRIDDRALDWVFDHEYGSVWSGLGTLSRETLPQLSCLTCPPNMLDCFGDVALSQLKVEWWDDPLCRLMLPSTDLGPYGLGGFDLRPYCDNLETLEIRSLDIESPRPIEFPSLRYLHLWHSTRLGQRISDFLSWMSFPQTTCIHVSDTFNEDKPSNFHRPLPMSNPNFQAVVGIVDRVVIHQPPYRKAANGYHIQCFAGDVERLRMDDYNVTAQGLLAVFGSGKAPVTHLTLSPESGNLVVDLRAFPQLQHLALSGRDMETVLSMLDSPSLCPSLFQLAITFGFAMGPIPDAGQATSSHPGGHDVGADVGVLVDTMFRQKCAALQTVLAQRVSDGCHSRLTSLVLCLRPTSASVPTMSEGDPDSSDSDSGSSHPAECLSQTGAPAESDTTVWPSHAVRQSVMQTLRELVDGPVVLKLVDRTGAEVAVDEV